MRCPPARLSRAALPAALGKRPTTLALSIAVGFAAGALRGAFAFEMMPRRRRLLRCRSPCPVSPAGFAFLYAFDLFVHCGASAGDKAAQRDWVLHVGGGGGHAATR